MEFSFSKYQGTGNDFILIDNRQGTVDLTQKQIERLCDRRFGIGADGLMKLQEADGYDFGMLYYNADGREGSMCGNGGRCITRFAYDSGIVKGKYHFIAFDGAHSSYIDEQDIIHLKMIPVEKIDHYSSYSFINTGSPHVVKTVNQIMNYEVVTEGRRIRNNEYYKKDGVNVNFVELIDDDHIYVRTYERGVEDETFSCGTGVTAAALVNFHNDNGFNHVDVKTLGGNLYVEYDKTGDQSFDNIWLCGPAKKVFSGKTNLV
ncbi:MAG: diaminopimelate epimerase [Bacteroidota bacterium]